MNKLIEEFEDLLEQVNEKASEIIKEAVILNEQLKNDYPNEERDREREVLGI